MQGAVVRWASSLSFWRVAAVGRKQASFWGNGLLEPLLMLKVHHGFRYLHTSVHCYTLHTSPRGEVAVSVHTVGHHSDIKEVSFDAPCNTAVGRGTPRPSPVRVHLHLVLEESDS